MTMKTRTLWRCGVPALCVGLAAAAHAQGADTGDVLFARAPMVGVHVVGLGDDTLAFAASELGGERIMKGAPYCADAVSEEIQTLADGNRIVRRQTTRLCRDGEGRTRQEIERDDGRSRIFLRDPVAGERWLLDPQHKTATRLPSHMTPLPPPADSSMWREYSNRARAYAERMREWVRGLGDRLRRDPESRGSQDEASAPPAPAVPPAPPTPALISHADGEAQRDVRVQVLRVDDAELPPSPAVPAIPLPPVVALRTLQLAPRGPGVSTSLGSKDIEGLQASGERTTWTIEAGRLGNEKPIVITREVWTSPDLMLTLSSRDFDPRSGEVLYRLSNLKRGEPDAALMRVPADYLVRGVGRAPKAPSPAGSKG